MSSDLRTPAVGVTVDRRQPWLDGFAMTASILCLIHCLLLPAVLVALPMLEAVLAIPEGFHPVAFALALPTSLLALRSGYARHGLKAPALVATGGLILLGLGAFAIGAETAERAVSSAGAALLALAHAWNWRALSHRPRRGAACPVEDAA